MTSCSPAWNPLSHSCLMLTARCDACDGIVAYLVSLGDDLIERQRAAELAIKWWVNRNCADRR